MAFVKPVTRALSELINPTIWNQDVVSNTLAMGPHEIARKTADESDTTGTLQNDDVLLAPVLANEVWEFEFTLFVTRTTSANGQVGFTFPSGNVAGLITGIAGSFAVSGSASPVSSGALTNVFTTSATGSPYTLRVIYTCGGTGGSLQLQWAQSGGGTMTVKANSTLWGVQRA